MFKIHKAYSTQYPANSYSANLGRTKIIVKALLNYILRKKEKKRHTTMIHRKKNPSHKLKHKGFVIIKKKIKKKEGTKITTGGIYNVLG